MINFDGNFAHGCPTCPALSQSYAGYKTREEVEKNTAERDAFINDWIKDLPYFTYKVITDCHDAEYTQWALDYMFQMKPQLEELVKGIPTANTMTIAGMVFCDPSLTYLAVVSGAIEGDAAATKPLLVRKVSPSWERPGEVKDFLVTRQTLDYLMKKHKFRLTDVKSVFFYKTSPALNHIYKALTLRRAQPGMSASNRELLKKVGNFSCGYFGLNANKSNTSGSTTLLLVADRPSNYNLSTCEFLPVGNVAGHNYYFFKRVTPRKGRIPCSSALPLFVSVVEYGKYRMSDFLCFLDKYMRPGSFRHLYSNVDNVILAMADTSLLNCAKDELMEEYLHESRTQFFEYGKPGHLKIEWTESSQDWKFVSAMPQNYALISASSTTSRHKNSALNHISSQQSYDASCAMLEKKSVTFEQLRRTHKLANLETCVKTFVFNK
jgi:hypothetical protein